MNIYDEVTLIIVCFNSEKLIRKNLNELKKFKIIIIDNSKSKKTFDLVKNFQNIDYLQTNKNLGYGQANNLGVNRATTPFIMILNPDILINFRAIKILHEKFHLYKNVGILAPSLYDNDNKRRSNGSISRLKNKISRVTTLKHKNLAQGDACFDFVVGCSLFMCKDFFQTIGGFDNDFFMYFEDNDLCDRVYKNNKYVIEIPDSKMIHMQGLSSDVNIMSNAKLSLIHKISECIYLKKNLSSSKLFLNLIIQLIDYFQRFFFNLIFLKIKKSFKNLLRIISIFLFFTSLYKLMY
jgi:GT2 family glycosyltransferase